jgi:ribosomal subunit interface protein
MQVVVQGKQMDVGDSLRSYATDKINEVLQKFFNRANDITVTFSPEGHGFKKAHISVHIGKQIEILATAIETEAYLAFDNALEKITKQMRRYKRRLRDHHERLEESPEAELSKARSYTLAAGLTSATEEVEEEEDLPQGNDPLVIAEMATAIQTMSVSDAVMRMDLAGQTAILFRNAKTGDLNMVYKRADGNIGWIDPAIQGKAATKAAAE